MHSVTTKQLAVERAKARMVVLAFAAVFFVVFVVLPATALAEATAH